MEEAAGKLWDRLVTRVTDTRHAAAAATLQEISHTAGVLFRALGGDAGLTVKPAQATEHGALRGFMQRLAGTGTKVELAWRNGEALYLPGEIALFPDRGLNRDLYLWLVALAAAIRPGDWFAASQRATVEVLTRLPGFESRYRRLLDAALTLRPEPSRLPADVAARERMLRQALCTPGSVATLPDANGSWYPVHLWLHPAPPRDQAASVPTSAAPDSTNGGDRRNTRDDPRRRQGERVEMPDGKDGFMLFFRAESILSWAEYVRVNRPTEDDDNDTDPASAADDFRTMSIARDGKAGAARVRFDLDLPPPELDDTPLGPGIALPEWHYKKNLMQPAHCRVQPMVATSAAPAALPAHLAAPARTIRRRFEALMPGRIWLRRQLEGSELDLDACIAHRADRNLRHPSAERGLYKALRAQERDLACLLLADLSLSTDAYVGDQARVIDVVRDSLFLFSEALSVTGDPFGLYGFSSLRRDNVRFHVLKDFSERYDARARGRIAAIRPGYYTRMGAAIRHATSILAEQRAHQRLLLILTDGKPNDLDHYEGRYGIEDTRHAILEARQKGLLPFCVTIDDKASDYLSHLFGIGRYVVIRKPADLPAQLPLLYAQLSH